MAVELAASESPTTIIEDGFDLAIHSGDLPDSTLVARGFAQTMIILVATPQYLTRHGAPESPDDLHRFLSVVFVERGSISGVRTRTYCCPTGQIAYCAMSSGRRQSVLVFRSISAGTLSGAPWRHCCKLPELRSKPRRTCSVTTAADSRWTCTRSRFPRTGEPRSQVSLGRCSQLPFLNVP